MEPLVQFLRAHTDWKLAVPTLPGHGKDASLKGIAYKEWLESAEQELEALISQCEHVYLIGFSMGGMIACHLAAYYPVHKIVLLSAAAKFINIRQMARDFRDLLSDARHGGLSDNELFRRYQDKVLKTPLSAAWQFRLLVSGRRNILKDVRIPAFIAQGTSDGIVPLKSAEYIYKNLASQDKQLYMVEGAKHLICYCDAREELFSAIHSFLEN
ncbi:alpha/beta hydrolase [Peribacillus sp. SCS-155]|uniref:alpha/beta hydrolase n=1 Tax=Peribacillus sedimenti TaxID=3115297 RepID=UPI003906D509